MAPVVNVVIAPALAPPALLACRFPAAAVIAPRANNMTALATMSTYRSMRNPPCVRSSFPLERRDGPLLTGLLAFELGLLLADEGHDADHRVLGHGRLAEVFGLDLIALARRSLQARQQGFFGQAQGDRRGPREPASALERGFVKSIGGERRVDQPDSRGLRRFESRRLEDHFRGAGPSDQAWQALRPTGARDQPQVGFCLTDRGATIVDHQPVIAGER